MRSTSAVHCPKKLLEIKTTPSSAGARERDAVQKSGIMTGLLEFAQDVGDGRYAKHGIGKRLRFELA